MRSILLLTLMALSSHALADNTYFCTKGVKERTIEVVHLTVDSPVPCEVRYTKSGGETKVVWRAKAQAGYCEAKAKAFAQKQRGFGWTCTGGE